MARNRGIKISDFLKTLIFFGLLAIVSAWLAARASVELAGEPKFIDGDSLRLNGQEVRLRGIDAPEYNQTCQSKVKGSEYPCGRQALDMLVSLVGQNEMNCEGWEFDKYDRLLGVCFVDDLDINEKMVRSGWAVSFGDYEGAEAKARADQIGIWSGKFDEPSTWRRKETDPHSTGFLSGLRFW